MRTLFRLCALVVMLFVLVGVSWAQDEATPEAIVDAVGVDVPVIVTDTPQVIVINTGGTGETGATVETTEASVTFSVTDLIILAFALLGVGVGAFNLFSKGKLSEADAHVQSELARLRADRDLMDRYERMYKELPASYKLVYDTMASALETISKYTPSKADDALLGLVGDIQKPNE